MRSSQALVVIWLLVLTAIQCKSDVFSEGKQIYKAYCSNCHMDDGSGLAALIPPLTDMEYLTDNKHLLPCIITQGQAGPIMVKDTLYDQVMPAADLSDIQLLNVINYIGNSWGNDLGYITITEVLKWKEQCPPTK